MVKLLLKHKISRAILKRAVKRKLGSHNIGNNKYLQKDFQSKVINVVYRGDRVDIVDVSRVGAIDWHVFVFVSTPRSLEISNHCVLFKIYAVFNSRRFLAST